MLHYTSHERPSKFCISATYEMRTTEYNGILYFNDNRHFLEDGFLYKMEREQTGGETEREQVCECECRPAPKVASVDIHKHRG